MALIDIRNGELTASVPESALPVYEKSGWSRVEPTSETTEPRRQRRAKEQSAPTTPVEHPLPTESEED